MMPKNAYFDDVPLDLQLDLLVDGELPEARRRTLLASLNGQPDGWRAVALRFLERQTEKQSVRALMAGGQLVPASIDLPETGARRSVLARIGWRRLTAVAAGLFIAASSALVTLVAVRSQGSSAEPMRVFPTKLPAEVVAAGTDVRVDVPVLPAALNGDVFQFNKSDNGRTTRNTILVQPDGRDGYMVIPVNTSVARVY